MGSLIDVLASQPKNRPTCITQAYKHSEFKYTESPNTTFKYGQKVGATEQGKAWVEGEKEGWDHLDPTKMDLSNLYLLMISAITPRPIAFVSTVSETGEENLALFSFFNMVSHNPPIISISVAVINGFKDTAKNIKATKQFTASIISEPWVDNANVCSIDAPPHFNEWSICGLTKESSVCVKPPRVKESAFSMECELYQETDIVSPVTGSVTSTLILGLVKHIHVRKDVLNERGSVEPKTLMPVGRMGDILYASLAGGFRIPRPVWKKEEGVIQEFLKGAQTDEA